MTGLPNATLIVRVCRGFIRNQPDTDAKMKRFRFFSVQHMRICGPNGSKS